MATAAGPIPERLTTERRHSRFFFVASVVLLGILLAGFAPTFFLNSYIAQRPIPTYVFIHGVLGTAWFVLLVVQTGLIATRRKPLHRRLGLAGFILASAMLISTTITAYRLFPHMESLGLEPRQVLQMGRLAQVVRDTLAIITFTAFVGLALLWRRNAQTHKRLMLLGALILSGAAVSRLGFILLPSMSASVSVWLLFIPMLVALAIHDLQSLGRIHRATFYGGAGFIAAMLFAIAVPTLLA